ncbi:MAG: protein kinase [Nannocystaceae bacterium]
MSAEHANKDRRFGRYVLKRSLGEGGNGQVFLAWQDNATGEPLPCVAKFSLQRDATDPQSCQRSLNEARLAMRLGSHPNIVQVIDVDVFQGMPFIVMEYIDGADLHTILGTLRRRGRRLSMPAIYNILASAATGLHHAHFGATRAGKAVGIVHRDVKPANLLITRDGITKLADFGISVALEDGVTGQHCRGTSRYMSPEHLRCEVRPEMDIYSLGVVAWEMVENRTYRGEHEGTQHFPAILDGKIPPLRNPETPRQLVSLIESCLDPNPRRRPTAVDLLNALAKCPGYSRDPALLAQEVASVLGTRRSSGATQQELAATPELIATLAVLSRSNDDSDDDTTKRTADNAPAPTVALRKAVRDDPPVADPTEEIEPDAPRIFRRPWANRVREASKTLKLDAGVGLAQGERHSHAKTPPIGAPWTDVGSPPVVAESPPRASTERRPPQAGQPLPPDEPLSPGRRRSSFGRSMVLRAFLGAAAVIVAALSTAHWLGAFDEAPTEVAAATRTSPLPPVDERALVPSKSSPKPRPPIETSPEVEMPDPVQPPPALPEPEPPSSGADHGVATTHEIDAPKPARAARVAAPNKPASSPVELSLVLFLVDEADVKIGRKVSHVSSKTQLSVAAGTHRVRWRLSGAEPWRDAGRHRFIAGHHYLVRVRSSGPEVIDAGGASR